MKSWIYSACSWAVFALALLGPSRLASAEPQPRQVVQIGVIVPLTGGLARRGEDVTRLIHILEPRLRERSHRYDFRFTIDDGRCGNGNSAVFALYTR